MASYRPFGMIRSGIWQSERFRSVASDDARLAYFWMHTSYKTCAGVLRIGPYHLLAEVDFVKGIERAEAIFNELEGAGLIIVLRHFVVIAKFLEANPVKSWMHAAGAIGDILELPEGELRGALFEEVIRHEGTRKLLVWRDKNGDPHPLVHVINAHRFEQIDNQSEELPNPSHDQSEGFGMGTSKKENKKKKEELRTQNDATSRIGSKGTDTSHETTQARPRGPLPETIRLAKKMLGE
jgi:hypothetical protein